MRFLHDMKQRQKFQELFPCKNLNEYIRSGMLTPRSDMPVFTAELQSAQIARRASLNSVFSSFKIGWS